MTSINEIQARISKYGTVSPNRFIVEFSPPNALLDLVGGTKKERLAIQCETAELPGKSFSTKEQRIYGPLRKFPYVATFTNIINLSFRIGNDFAERSIFDEWQRKVMDPSTNLFGYYEDYITDLIIHQLDRADERIYSVKLIESWPHEIQPITLSAATMNAYERQTIGFTFYKWRDVTKEVPPFTISSTTTTKKAEGGKIEELVLRGAGAFFDQLPRITGSGGTLFGSVLRNK